MEVDLLEDLFIQLLRVDHHLKIVKAGAVVEGDKAVVAECANPSHDGDGLVQGGLLQNGGDFQALAHVFQVAVAKDYFFPILMKLLLSVLSALAVLKF